MSLGLDVVQSTINGHQGPVPSKPTKGQDSLGDAFLVMIAAVMGQTAQPRQAEPAKVETAESDSAISVDCAASDGLALGHVTAAAPESLDLHEVEDAVFGTAERQTAGVAGSVTAQGYAQVVSPSGPISHELSSFPQGAAALAHGAASDNATVTTNATVAANVTVVDNATVSDWVLQSGVRVAPDASSSANGTEVSGESREVLAANTPDVPKISGQRQQSNAPSILLDAARLEGSDTPEVTNEGESGEAGVSLPDAVATGEDVVPKTGVDAGTGSQLGARETLRQAQRMATEDSSVGEVGAESLTDKIRHEVLEGFEAALGKLRLQAESGSDEPKEVGEDNPADGSDTTDEVGADLDAASMPGADELLTSMNERMSASAAPGGGVGADSRVESGSTELSLENVRAVADRLREEALKRLPRSVEFCLDPPELGKVTVLLSARGQDVAVKFVASGGEAQRALSEASSELAKALSEKGLSLAGFSVDQGERDGSSQTRDSRSQAFAWSKGPRTTRETPHIVRRGLVAGKYGRGAFDYLV